MNGLPNTILIAMTELQDILEGTPGGIEEKLLIAMRHTRNHWLLREEEGRFKAAVGAVMTHYGEESAEFAQLAEETRRINLMNEFLRAVQAGLNVSLPEDMDMNFVPVGLVNLWQQVREEA